MDDLEKVKTALASGADVLMVDFEIEPARREAARRGLHTLFELQPALPVFVRVAAASRPDELAEDLAVAVRDGLTGVIVPECEHPDELRTVAERLDLLEREQGLPAGGISLLPLPETALAIRRYFEILTASPRVVAAWLPGSEGGDLAGDVGYVWSREGTELIYLRSKVVLDARAAGVRHILDGGWRALADTEGFEQDSAASRGFGFTGRMVFDAAQAAIANRVYPAPVEQ
jgi:citrate lyase subunit beta/citryl-CoA lyase